MAVTFRRTGQFSGEGSFSTGLGPEAVFDYLADLEKHPEWSEGLARLTKTSAGDGLGTTYRTEEAMRSGSKMKAETLAEITALDRPRLIAWKAQTADQRWPMGARSEWSFRIEPEGSGSRVTQTMSLTPKSKAFVKAFVFVADTFFGGLGASPKAIRKNLERLEAKLQSMAR